jgi:D-sedoheptulose 7-phosphate isomerase
VRADFRASCEEHAAVLAGLEHVLAVHLDPAVTMIAEGLVEEQKILTCGCGISLTAAEALVAQFRVRFTTPRKAYPAIALTAGAALTASVVDQGAARMFSRQVEALGDSRDVLIAIACDIPHQSIIEAVAAAKRAGMRTLGLCARVGLGCDVDICVPSNFSPRVHEMHVLVVNLIIEAVEGRLPV